MTNKLLSATVACVLGLAASFSNVPEANAQTVDELVQKGVVKIGVLSGNPPYDRIDDKGNVVGHSVDVAKRIAELMGVKAEIVPLVNAARIPALVSGRIDILVGSLVPSPERAKAVMFTSPYGGFETVIVGRNDLDVKSAKEMAGRSIAVPKSSLQDTVITAMNIDGLAIKRFDDDALANQALQSGQVDLTTSNRTTANDLYKGTKFNIKFSLYTQYFSIAVRRQQFDLLQWLNNTIFYLKTTGELEAIHQKWTHEPLPTIEGMGKFPTF